MLTHNMFAYCLNNPVSMIDPNGEFAFVAAFIAAPLIIKATLVLGTALTAVYSYYTVVKPTANYIRNQMNYSTRRKPVNLPSFSKLKIDIEHILSGQTPNGNRNPKGEKDIFWGMTAEAIRRAIKEAYNVGEKVKTQGDLVLINGYSKTYKIVVGIWVNIKDKIIETAYPK